MAQMKSLVYARRNPYILMMWLSIVGSSIVFIFITFIYYSRWADTSVAPLPIPGAFWVSTPALLLSSISLYQSQISFKNEDYSTHRLLLLITFCLGALFALMQGAGWYFLREKGIFVGAGQMGGTFVYLLSGLHGLHVMAGLGALGYLVWDSFRNRSYVESFLIGFNPFKQARMRLFVIYWHFVDAVWLAMFLLFLYRQ